MLADRLKNGTVAKVAMRVAELYAAARDAAELARAGSEGAQPFAFPEVRSPVLLPWPAGPAPSDADPDPSLARPQDILRYLAVKHAHFTAVAHYRRSLDDLGANRYGDELGRLQLADAKLREVTALGRRGVPEAVMHDLKVRRALSDLLSRSCRGTS